MQKLAKFKFAHYQPSYYFITFQYKETRDHDSWQYASGINMRFREDLESIREKYPNFHNISDCSNSTASIHTTIGNLFSPRLLDRSGTMKVYGLCEHKLNPTLIAHLKNPEEIRSWYLQNR